MYIGSIYRNFIIFIIFAISIQYSFIFSMDKNNTSNYFNFMGLPPEIQFNILELFFSNYEDIEEAVISDFKKCKEYSEIVLGDKIDYKKLFEKRKFNEYINSLYKVIEDKIKNISLVCRSFNEILFDINNFYKKHNMSLREKILSKYLNNKVVDIDNSTLLMYAAGYGDVDAVKTLISKNVDINKLNKNLLSALDFAVEYKHKNVAKILLDNKANLNKIDKFNITPLISAISNKDIEMVKLLLEYKPDTNIKFKNMTLYDIAKFYGSIEIMALLQK